MTPMTMIYAVLLHWLNLFQYVMDCQVLVVLTAVSSHVTMCLISLCILHCCNFLLLYFCALYFSYTYCTIIHNK